MAYNGKQNVPFVNIGDVVSQITGDVTVTSAGVSSIGAGKVTKEKLSSGISGTHYVFNAQKVAMTNGAATKDVTVTGVAATDILLAVATTLTGATPVLKVAYKSANTVTITLSGDATTGDEVFLVTLRATS